MKVDFGYPVGIRFECNRCGLCCGDTNQRTRHILLLKNEAEKISLQTSQPIASFLDEISGKFPYVYEVKKSMEGKCVFLENNHCTIYSLRPLICVFYPFELKFNEDKESHDFGFTVECPGINQGKLLNKADFKRLFDMAQERLVQKTGS
jgi:Fe-S-cluster containining protein